MSQNAAKNVEQGDHVINNFMGGMDNSHPATTLQDNQCQLIENFYYPKGSGRLRTRYPFRRHTNTIIAGNDRAVTGICYWDGTIYFSCAGSLFYLDANQNSQILGALTGGNTYPSMLPFNAKLLVASGGELQALDSSLVFSTLATNLTHKQILEKWGYVWSVGDTTYYYRVSHSKYQDHTGWSGGNSAYYDVTYQNKNLCPSAMYDFAQDYFMVFSVGDGDRGVHRLYNLDQTTAYNQKVSSTQTTNTHRGLAEANNILYFMDTYSAMNMLYNTDTERLEINAAIGEQITSTWDMTEDAFCVTYPPDAQIWFFPKKDGIIYVYHYLTGAWTQFKVPGGLIFSSACYVPPSFTNSDNIGKLYLGGNDGYIYIYDTTSADYQDDVFGTDTDYRQRIVTKCYEIYPRTEHVIKVPGINYLGLKTGTGTFKVYSDYGATYQSSNSITYSSSYPTLYSLASTKLYNTVNTLLYVSDMRDQQINADLVANNFTIHITMDSGAIELQNLKITVGQGRKEI